MMVTNQLSDLFAKFETKKILLEEKFNVGLKFDEIITLTRASRIREPMYALE